MHVHSVSYAHQAKSWKTNSSSMHGVNKSPHKSACAVLDSAWWRCHETGAEKWKMGLGKWSLKKSSDRSQSLKSSLNTQYHPVLRPLHMWIYIQLFVKTSFFRHTCRAHLKQMHSWWNIEESLWQTEEIQFLLSLLSIQGKRGWGVQREEEHSDLRKKGTNSRGGWGKRWEEEAAKHSQTEEDQNRQRDGDQLCN